MSSLSTTLSFGGLNEVTETMRKRGVDYLCRKGMLVSQISRTTVVDKFVKAGEDAIIGLKAGDANTEAFVRKLFNSEMLTKLSTTENDKKREDVIEKMSKAELLKNFELQIKLLREETPSEMDTPETLNDFIEKLFVFNPRYMELICADNPLISIEDDDPDFMETLVENASVEEFMVRYQNEAVDPLLHLLANQNYHARAFVISYVQQQLDFIKSIVLECSVPEENAHMVFPTKIIYDDSMLPENLKM